MYRPGNGRRRLKCIERRQYASVVIISGISVLLPSALSLTTYWTKWIPEAQKQDAATGGNAAFWMKAALTGSISAAAILVGGSLYYLQKHGCLIGENGKKH